MMTQYLEARRAHPDAVLLFRMGDFYETFFDDAHLLARVTGIALTSRNAADSDPIPLAGFPWHNAEPYIARLLKAGHRVAICEQVEEPGKGKKLLARKVVEVLSPGTTLADSLLQAGSNNFIAALRSGASGRFGLAAADISTGELLLDDLNALEAREELARLSPAEILLTEEERTGLGEWIADLVPAPFLTILDPWKFSRDRGRSALLERFHLASLDAFEAEDLGPALGAAGALLEYAEEQKQSDLGHLRPPRRLRPGEGLILDDSTLRSLEILEPLPGGDASSTLLHCLDFTLTAAGSRLLRSALRRPLADVESIRRRQDRIEILLDGRLRASLRALLKETADVERILAKLHCGRAQPRDLAGLRQTLRTAPKIGSLLSGSPETATVVVSGPGFVPGAGQTDVAPGPGFVSGAGKPVVAPGPGLLPGAGPPPAALPAPPVEELRALSERMEAALVDAPPALLADGGVFRDAFDPELAEMRSLSRDAKSWIARLQEEERTRTGIPGLKVGFNRVFGYYIEVSQSQLGKVPDRYVRKQTLAGAERFLTPELKEFEEKVLHAEEEATRRERVLFEALCEEIRNRTSALQDLARALAELDFLQGLAEAAARRRWVRPEVDPGIRLVLRDGRHPVVEESLGPGTFIPNDTELDGDLEQVAILTGPNMAGKSTYLRQVGLITVMAQLGSFVPAASAEIGLCDRIFTRVGAHDSLARGQSTFLVEMIETSRILHHATRRSLVLLDEVGRGTSTYDGLAIAWAVAEALESRSGPKPRTIFATHFHELTRLARPGRGFRNLNVEVKEWGDQVVFLRRVVEGAADRSYGIHVAQLAGVPESVIRRARTILERLEEEARRITPAAEGGAAVAIPGGSSSSRAAEGTGAAPQGPAGETGATSDRPSKGTDAAQRGPAGEHDAMVHRPSAEPGMEVGQPAEVVSERDPGEARAGADALPSGVDRRGAPSGGIQLSLFGPPEPRFVEDLRKLDLERISPLEALTLLHRWKEELY